MALILPPSLPVNATTFNPFNIAHSIALSIFLLFPDVEIAINKSPFLPIASISLEKMYSNPKSLAIAVTLDMLDEREIEEIAFLSFSNRRHQVR